MGLNNSIDQFCRAEIKRIARRELETAWLRGYEKARWHQEAGDGLEVGEELAREAADYAERVIGGSTRPERPGIGDV